MKHKLTAGMAIVFIVIVGSILTGTVLLNRDRSESVKAENRDGTKVASVKAEVTEGKTTNLQLDYEDQKGNNKVSSLKRNFYKSVTDEGRSTKPSNQLDDQKSEATSKPKRTTTDSQTTEDRNTESKPVQTTEEQRTTQEATTTEQSQNSTEQTPTTEVPRPETTEAQTTAQSTTEATTEKEKVWHPAVTKKVWVVDVEAWDETITYTDYETHDVCSTCGAYIDGGPEVLESHVNNSVRWAEEHGLPLEQACLGAFRTISVPIEKTEVVHHDEEGHWETVVIKEGYWE